MCLDAGKDPSYTNGSILILLAMAETSIVCSFTPHPMHGSTAAGMNAVVRPARMSLCVSERC
jgi:hypothetical protein